DESVLFLANYETPDPIGELYSGRAAGVDDYYFRNFLQLADTTKVYDSYVVNPTDAQYSTIIDEKKIVGLPVNGRNYGLLASLVSGGYGAEYGKNTGGLVTLEQLSNFPTQRNQPTVTIRTNFNALAVFAASVPTDRQGQAQVR